MKTLLASALFTSLMLANVLAGAADMPIAKFGDTVLTEDQMRKDLGQQLYQAENNLYMIKKSWIDQKAEGYAFDRAAKEAGLSRQAWEAREIDAMVPQPDTNQIQQMAGRFARPGVASTETLKMAADALTTQNKQVRRAHLFQELSKKYPVEILVVKPEAPRINVTYAPDDPSKGSRQAPVTIVEFTDFQCPFCKRAMETLKQVEKAYPKEVRIIARQYPLPFHDRGKPAAEAALCAKEQGKYWEYREKLFENQTHLDDADFRTYAKDAGLNAKKFDQCLSEHRQAARVEADLADGKRFGVNGTPHFFINGESVVGAQPYESFKQAIDSALSKKK